MFTLVRLKTDITFSLTVNRIYRSYRMRVVRHSGTKRPRMNFHAARRAETIL